MQCNSIKFNTMALPPRPVEPLKLNIVTPVTRLANLKEIEQSVGPRSALYEPKDVSVYWHLFIDATVRDQINCAQMPDWGWHLSPLTGIAGHIHRNTFLVLNEWVYRSSDPLAKREWIMSLDDDNILHPDLIPWLIANRHIVQHYDGIIFDQVFRNGVTRLKADPDKVTVGNIDTAQYMFRASIVEGLRFDETRYDADGVFIEELYQRHKDKFLFVNQPLCYYNYLRS